jgi:hypothetical protein
MHYSPNSDRCKAFTFHVVFTKQYGKDFNLLTAEQRDEVLHALEADKVGWKLIGFPGVAAYARSCRRRG